jgi:predicted nucleotidyltransferase component of viral defense system
MRDLSPISRARFLAEIPPEQRVTLTERYEADFALTRLVHLNCAAIDEFDETPTKLVLKGGFAVRHIYAGPRFSRDADVLPADPDLDFLGPDDLLIPAGMERGQTTVGDAIQSWKVRIRYAMISRRATGTISCDVNDLQRLLRQRPPQRAMFESRLVDPFPVWAATVEEIVGEKLAALMRRRADRIRDAFDIHHVLAQPDVAIDRAAALLLYADSAKRQGVNVAIAMVPAAVRAMVTDPSVLEAWSAQLEGALASGVPAFPPLAETLAHLVETRLLADGAP